MQGLILAAGMGKRLKDLTAGNTKCMVKVNNQTIIERTLSILDKKMLSKIVIVVGYEGQKLVDFIATLKIKTPIIYINNPIYDKTNNIYSLSLAKEYLINEDTLLLESDIIFEESVIDSILQDKRESLALVDKFESWMDGTCTILDDEDCIIDFIPGKYLQFNKKDNYYKTVNIYKFSRHFSMKTYVPFLEAYSKAMGDNEYYESVIKLISLLETKELRAKRLEGQIWYEIDDIQDLNIAETLFAENDEERYKLIANRYGGYWRYPKLLDFCYLVNPYYPSEKMIKEIKSNFETLLTQYPSGMEINSLLASKHFGVNINNIVIGNGAAELINALMDIFKEAGEIGFIRPTFEEYPNRFDKNKSIYMIVDNVDFSYTADDIISYFSKKTVSVIVLINPDNPSGNYIDKSGIYKLIKWCREKNIKIILDESFVDFSCDAAMPDTEKALEEITMVRREVFDMYREGLFVVKSISKSYGVPGIRLGILASGNVEIISQLKKKVSIWNINSFAEFFMQISDKYKKDYYTGIEKIVSARKKLFDDLNKIDYLRPIPSKANYIMCELNGVRSKDLACYLLKNNIFIKVLTDKIANGREYIRLSVRNEYDNKRLIDLLTAYNYT